jgi:hypothetical protein
MVRKKAALEAADKIFSFDYEKDELEPNLNFLEKPQGSFS